ncbi:hypothetical protein BANRA_05546 [Klebsiella pneumoniae]|nr:hypothetical protein BANRA_05546 [Klebsiella pneumoniae]
MWIVLNELFKVDNGAISVREIIDFELITTEIEFLNFESLDIILKIKNPFSYHMRAKRTCFN